jgi:hypothetical protein
VTDSIERLSLPDQKLDASYFGKVLAFSQKSVIAAPCGYGKTLGVAAFMAEQWQEGILYVAERKEQLDTMKRLLVEEHGINPNRIGLYYSGSDDIGSLEQDGDRKPIALVTHARMLSYSPDAYVLFGSTGTPLSRQLLICDEAVVPLQILRIPRLFVQSFLTEMGLSWQDVGRVAVEEIATRISMIQPLLTAHAKVKFAQVGIRYLPWTDTLPDFDRKGKKGSDRAEHIRRHAYELLIHQLLCGKFCTQQDAVDVLIPLAPHLSWFAMVPHILVLDATAHITDYLYTDYTILRPGRWNYQDITSAWHLRMGIGNHSRTAISKYQETFLEHVERWLPYLLQEPGFGNPHVVTYKHLSNDQELLPDVIADKLKIPVRHYGSTRGSNAFLDTDSAILLGGFRTPGEFDTLASQLYENYSPYKYALAHWIQELYRTRIRQRNGEQIHLAVLGEENIVDLLEEEIHTLLPSWRTSGPLNLEGYERFLQGQKKQTRLNLLKELKTNKQVHVQTFAKHHTSRSVDKVWRALNTLLTNIPELKPHIRGKQGDEYIFLVEKPAPL